MKKSILIIIILVVFSWVGLLLAANQWYFWYWVSNTLSVAKLNQSAGSAGAVSTSVSKVEEHGICKTITSTNTKLLFVPTKTATERSTFITKKPNHIILGSCGCTTNSDCSVWSICSWYVAGAWYCDGEFVYNSPAYCQNDCRDGPTCDPCTGVTNQWDCESQTQWDPWYEFQACSRIPEQPWWTAYCGQEFRTQSECNTAPSECTWVNWTATPWTCVAPVAVCWNGIIEGTEQCDEPANMWDMTSCSRTENLQQKCSSCHCQTTCQSYIDPNAWRVVCSM